MKKTDVSRIASKILTSESPVIEYDSVPQDSLRINSDGDIFFITYSSFYRGVPFAGSVFTTYPSGYNIVKINSSGDLNTTFMTNMGYQSSGTIEEGYITGFDIDPNTDDLIITGSFRSWNNVAINHTGIIRVTKAGVAVSAFNTALGNGLQEASRAFFSGQVTGMTTDVYIISLLYNNPTITLNYNGTDTIDTVIAAWNAANPSNPVYLDTGNGAQIPSNGQSMAIAMAGSPRKNAIYSSYTCKILANGKALIMGVYNGFNDTYTYRSGIILLNTNGTLDTTFTGNVSNAIDVWWWDYRVYTAVELSTGAIVFVGSFGYSSDIYGNQGWDGNGMNYIAKVSSTGVTDATFETNAGTGFDDVTYSIVADGSDNLYIGGWQYLYNDVYIPRCLTKLSSSGILDVTFTENMGQFRYSGFEDRVRQVRLDGTDVIVGGNFTELVVGDTKPTYTGTIAGTATPVTITGTYEGIESWFDLTFDGIITINTAISNHNTAEPLRPCSLISGDGTQIPNNLVNIYQEGTDTVYNASALAKLSTSGVFNSTFQTNMGDTSSMYVVWALLVDSGYYYAFGDIASFDTEQYDTIGRVNDDGTYDAWFYPEAVNNTWTAPSGVTKIGISMINSVDSLPFNETIMDVTPNTTYTIDTTPPTHALFNTYRYQGYNYIKIWWIP